MKNSDLPDVLYSRMEGIRPGDDFESDGCTWAPDYFGPYDLRPACMVHDFGYHLIRENYAATGSLREAEAYRASIDRQFYRNLRSCGASRTLAGIYYRRVRMHGLIAIGYDPPLSNWQLWSRWLLLGITRYLPAW